MKLRCTSDDSNADALSRIPLREISAQTEIPAELVLLIEYLQVPQSQPIKFKYGPEETLPFPQFTLFTAWLALQHGWPTNKPVNLFFQKYQTFSPRRMHIVGNRVVIPPEGGQPYCKNFMRSPRHSQLKALASMCVCMYGGPDLTQILKKLTAIVQTAK